MTAQFCLEESWAAPRVKDILNGELKWKLQALRLWARNQGVREEFDYRKIHQAYYRFASKVIMTQSSAIRMVIDGSRCVFEGAQGVLLDEWHGFHPHTTWSTTTFENIRPARGGPDRGGLLSRIRR